jgi:hypothetical protein
MLISLGYSEYTQNSRMDKPETTEMAFKNGQSRDNRNGIKE